MRTIRRRGMVSSSALAATLPPVIFPYGSATPTPTPGYSPSLNFSDSRNSQYVAVVAF